MHSVRAIPDPKFLLLLCHTPGNLSLLVPALGTLKSTGFPTCTLEPLLPGPSSGFHAHSSTTWEVLSP